MNKNNTKLDKKTIEKDAKRFVISADEIIKKQIEVENKEVANEEN